MANETIFRDKAIERISSPEQLNDYVRLSDPGVWLILASVTVLLLGAVIFGTVGTIDSTVPGVGVARNAQMTCLVKKEYGDRLEESLSVVIDGNEHSATLRDSKPVPVWDTTDPYTLYVGDMQPGEWVYEIDVDGMFTDGTYEVKVIAEKVSPMSFLFGNR